MFLHCVKWKSCVTVCASLEQTIDCRYNTCLLKVLQVYQLLPSGEVQQTEEKCTLGAVIVGCSPVFDLPGAMAYSPLGYSYPTTPQVPCAFYHTDSFHNVQITARLPFLTNLSRRHYEKNKFKLQKQLKSLILREKKTTEQNNHRKTGLVRSHTFRIILVGFSTVPDVIQPAGRLSGARNASLALVAALPKSARPRHWSLQRPISKDPRIL